MFAARPPSLIDAVEARRREDVLAHERHRVLEDLDGVEGAAAEPWIRRGVRRLSEELDVDRRDREAAAGVEVVLGLGVPGEDDVRAREGPVPQHERLAEDLLLGGRPEDADRAGELSARSARGSRRRRPRRRRSRGGCGRTRDPGAPATTGDFFASPAFCERPGRASYSARIATTGAPEPGARHERRRHSGDAARHGEALLLEDLLEERGRLRLLERRLGVVPDLPGDLLPARGGRVEPGVRPGGRGRGAAGAAASRAESQAEREGGRAAERNLHRRLRTGDVSLEKDSIRWRNAKESRPGPDPPRPVGGPLPASRRLPGTPRRRGSTRRGSRSRSTCASSISVARARRRRSGSCFRSAGETSAGRRNAQPRVDSFFLAGDVTSEKGEAVETFRVPVDVDLSVSDVTNASKPVAITFLRALPPGTFNLQFRLEGVAGRILGTRAISLTVPAMSSEFRAEDAGGDSAGMPSAAAVVLESENRPARSAGTRGAS